MSWSDTTPVGETWPARLHASAEIGGANPKAISRTYNT
jgi:hypothetical protein